MSKLKERAAGFVVVTFGRPCSGKDEQGKFLQGHFQEIFGADGVDYLVCSELLNWRKKAHDTLAAEITNAFRECTTTRLLPSGIVCEAVSEHFECLLKTVKFVVLNGFPRDYEQGLHLKKIVGHDRIVAVKLEIPREMALHRATKRKQGRPEDVLEAAIIRQDIYEAEEPGLIQALNESNIPIIPIDATPELDQVSDELRMELEGFFQFQLPAEKHARQHLIPLSLVI